MFPIYQTPTHVQHEWAKLGQCVHIPHTIRTNRVFHTLTAHVVQCKYTYNVHVIEYAKGQNVDMDS